MEAKKGSFKLFLKEISKSKDMHKDSLEVLDIYPILSISDLKPEDVTDYIFSIKPEDIAFEMKIRGVATGLQRFAVNPFTQRYCFLPTNHYSSYLEALVEDTASKYGIKKVDNVVKLYKRRSNAKPRDWCKTEGTGSEG